ncbi:hypothetical protein [Mesorhizobium sp.]|uniref:hypothetical protein n=1 Tax=Mesorhizobium sp. TaxID=1871066 RepID=UPI000FE60D5E|nr:hypothetical protein [Mesorhizobium sp.]RWJ32014.1 MAG: hypothetical protein EOR28_14680 [Mesorhizobium sp.]TIQ73780.1 MAG: hypothetical protein E5X40_05185 [Mesorhizobium sp.]
MPSGNGIGFHVPRYDFTVRAKWLERNARLIDVIRASLPTRCLYSHVVVSGQTIGAVTRIRYDGPGVMVPRVFGSVFFYQPSQKINLCYGEITESATVNQFAEVVPEDLDTLRTLGGRVWADTVANPVRYNVEVEIQEW